MCTDALDKIRYCGGGSNGGKGKDEKSDAEIGIARSMRFSLYQAQAPISFFF